MKTCKKCEIEKPIEDFYFYKSKKFRDGLCRACRNQFNKNWRRQKSSSIFYKREELLKQDKNVCHVCEKVKPLQAFSKSKHVTTGYHNTCKSCKSLADKNTKLKACYGISLDHYNQMLASQKGVCKICMSKLTGTKNVCVDHDHKTQLIRGLLCNRCNRGLGLFQDDVKILLSAAKYLKTASPLDK